MAENLVSDRQFFMQKILKQNTGEIKTVVSARSLVISFEQLAVQVHTNYSLQHSMGLVQVVM
jgi:hypothetical protein